MAQLERFTSGKTHRTKLLIDGRVTLGSSRSSLNGDVEYHIAISDPYSETTDSPTYSYFLRLSELEVEDLIRWYRQRKHDGS